MMNPTLRSMVDGLDVIDSATSFEENIKPLPEQTELTVGDWALALVGESAVDQDAALVEVCDPQDYAARYPDWARRVQRGYVLAHWRTAADPMPRVGWWARSRLLPLTAEEAEQVAQEFLEQTEEPPEWLKQRHLEMLDRAAAGAPEQIAKPVMCPNCGSREVSIHLMVQGEAVGKAGELLQNGKTVITPIGTNTPNFEMKFGAHLNCHKCQANAHLEEHEVDPNIHWPHSW